MSEKLIQTARDVESISDGLPINFSKIGSQSQDLLRGKFQERTELMHLHTTTHGTRRWSGDKESLEINPEYNENSGNTNPRQIVSATVTKSKHSKVVSSLTPSNISRPQTGKIVPGRKVI